MSVKVCCGECGTKTEVVENFKCPVCASNSGSANTSTNKQSTAIAQIADEMEEAYTKYGIYWTNHVNELRKWCQQLRTL